MKNTRLKIKTPLKATGLNEYGFCLPCVHYLLHSEAGFVCAAGEIRLREDRA